MEYFEIEEINSLSRRAWRKGFINSLFNNVKI